MKLGWRERGRLAFSILTGKKMRVHPSNPAQWLVDLFGGNTGTAAGIDVTPEKALQTSAVFACIRVLSSQIAQLPLQLMRRTGSGKEPALDHPVYPLLHTSPHPESTAYEFRETLQSHLSLRGKAFAQIVRNNAGEVIELVPLHPDKMKIRRDPDSTRLLYVYRPKNNQEVIFDVDEILHLRGMGADGLNTYSPIELAKETIGAALAAEENAALLLGNDSVPPLALTHPEQLKEETIERLRSEWQRLQGGRNKGKVAVLEEGLKVEKIGMTPEDAQYLETRKFGVVEIARIFGVPPHKIADLDRATFSNIEEQNRDFLTDSLMPHIVRWEQRLNMALLTEVERATLFFKHNVMGLLRADSTKRSQFYREQWGIGALSVNEIRELEDVNGIGEDGDQRFVPLNMVPLDQAGMVAQMEPRRLERAADNPHVWRPGEQQRSLDRRRELAQEFQPLIGKEAERLVRRETKAVRRLVRDKLAKGEIGAFRDGLESFYEDLHPLIVRDLGPVFVSLAKLVTRSISAEVESREGTVDYEEDVAEFVDDVSTAYAHRHIHSSENQIGSIIFDHQITENGTEAASADIEQRLDEWEEKRPEKIAKNESTRVANAVSSVAYAAAGASFLVWRALRGECPLCQRLDGTRIPIRSQFLQKGDNIEPDGEGSAPLKVRSDIKHPPLHRGCRCAITAEF